jgi:hypothetical protein
MLHNRTCYWWQFKALQLRRIALLTQLIHCVLFCASAIEFNSAVRDQEEVATLWKQHTAGLRKALAQRDTLLHAYRSELASSIAALGQAAAQAKQIEHTAVAAVSVRRTALLAMHSCCDVHLYVQQR